MNDTLSDHRPRGGGVARRLYEDLKLIPARSGAGRDPVVGACRRALSAGSVLVLLAACAGTGPSHAEPAVSGRPVNSSDRIVIREQSNVCVSVHVDQRVWPTPLLPNADINFSGTLFSQMRMLFEREGGSAFLPGPKRDHRFVSNTHGNNPLCSDDGGDIHVAASYMPRPDGTPFMFSYQIRQGDVVRTGSVTRDIEEEWRSGRLPRVHKQEPLQAAISDDLRSRAEFLLKQVEWEQ